MNKVKAITFPAKRHVTVTGSLGGPPHRRDLANSTLTFSRFLSSQDGRVSVSAKGEGNFDPDDIQKALRLVKLDINIPVRGAAETPGIEQLKDAGEFYKYEGKWYTPNGEYRTPSCEHRDVYLALLNDQPLRAMTSSSSRYPRQFRTILRLVKHGDWRKRTNEVWSACPKVSEPHWEHCPEDALETFINFHEDCFAD
jgi:hypothetical protein